MTEERFDYQQQLEADERQRREYEDWQRYFRRAWTDLVMNETKGAANEPVKSD